MPPSNFDPFSDAGTDEMVRLYVEEGIKNFKQIGLAVGVSGILVKRRLISRGVEITITRGRPPGLSKEIAEKEPQILVLYVERGMTIEAISQRLSINTETIAKVLNKNNVTIKTSQDFYRSMSSGEQQTIKDKISETKTGNSFWTEDMYVKKAENVEKNQQETYEWRACVICSGQFWVRKKYNRSTDSPECESAHRSQVMSKIPSQMAFVQSCPCGIPLRLKEGKYCSPEHRELYSRYNFLPENQSKMLLCKNCDEWFEKRTYPGENSHEYTYCSYGCSTEDLNSWHGKQRDVLGVTCLSGLEEKFVLLCKALDIPVRAFNRKQTGDGLMKYTRENGQASVYGPDFFVYLYGEEIPVEVKGWYKPEDRVKVNTWRKRKGDLLVADEKVVDEFETEAKKSFLIDRLMAQMAAHRQGLYDDATMRAVKAELSEPAYQEYPERVGLDVSVETYSKSLENWSK